MAAFLAGAFLFIIVLTLLFFGSVGTAPFSVVSSLMFALSLPNAFVFGEPRHTRAPFNLALFILLVLALWTFVQTLNLSSLLPSDTVWRNARGLVGTQNVSISASPADTLEALLRIAMPLVTFINALLLCSSDDRSRTMLVGLGLIGGFVSLFGLLQFIMSPATLVVVDKEFYLDSLTGVFVNRNTAATFLGATVLIILVLTWEKLQSVNVRRAIVQMQDWRSPRGGGMGRAIIYLILLGASVTALLLTKSRAGVASTFVALLFLVPFLAANWTRQRATDFGRSTTPGWQKLLSRAVAIAVVLIAFFIFAGQVLLRAQVRGTDDGRFCVLPNILKMLSDHYWIGTGPATFRWMFPAYRDPGCGILGVWDRAHDVYLEGSLAFGIVFPILLIVALVALFIFLREGLRTRKRMRHYPALGFAMLVLVGLHSAIDFSLQIPGFAVFFAALMAPVISLSLGRRSQLTRQRQPDRGN
ncbi:O-antigen ligase family protein [Rhizobium sp. BK376]|uniref:O-antigen ligase family protein n=1 Tax=Rhizobium sp. BK376 TaxID=2512149 RepID=UPI001048714F|nr:O-antigen ligase family protein [Rhizobium sp. BK376]